MATKKINSETSEAPTSENTTNEAPSASIAPKATPLKKITIQTVFGNIKPKDWFRANRAAIMEACEKSDNGTIHICRIWGKVIKTSVGSSDNGEFIRFMGQFYGVSGLTGEYYTAATCLLPKWLEREVDAAFSIDGDTVYFGYDIFMKMAPDAALGYEYVADSLTQPKTDMSFIEEKFPSLPAPAGTLLRAAPNAKAA